METKIDLAKLDSNASHSTPVDNQFEDDNVKLIRYNNTTVQRKESKAEVTLSSVVAM